MNWIFYLLAIGAGAANPAQAGANAQLKKSLDQAILAAIAVYLSGLLGVLIIQMIVREAWPGADKFNDTPWWAWTGGLISIASTLSGITFAEKMGSGLFTGLTITASIATSIVLDHFGLLGFKVHPVSWPRALGCGLMICGLWLVAKF